MGVSRIYIVAGLLCLYSSATSLPANTKGSVDALIEDGHWKRARQAVEARLKSNQNDAQAHAWLSKIDSGFGDLEGSIAEAERAVEIDPNSAAFRGQLAEANALMADRSSVLKGLIYARRMKKEIAASLAIDPNHIDTLLVEMMYDWKAPTMAGGDRNHAWQIAAHIGQVSPVWGDLARARLAEDEGDDKEVESALRKAVDADPSFYRARLALARFYCCTARQKRYGQAEKIARDAIALDPSKAGGWEILARVYAAERRGPELNDTLMRAENAAPDDLTPYYAAASVLYETGQDFPHAEQYLARYLAEPVEGREPSRAEACWLLAELYEHEGRKSDAVRELQVAVHLDPAFEPARRDLYRLRHT
ncbi:MAG: tetratricopeptide repeat protein [Bryobacteraceae bacterium]